MDDRHIISLFLARAEGAIDALASKFGHVLHRICYNILGSAEDAEECVSDTYLAVWNAIPPAEPDPLGAYIYKIGRNTALKRLRSRTAQKRSAYEVSLEELAGCIPDNTTGDTLDGRELGRAIDRWLATQSPESRALFLRRYWFGDSVKDLAKVFGATENALSVRLSRLRAALKQHLTEEGYFHES